MRAAWPEKVAVAIMALEVCAFILLTVGNPHAMTEDWFASLGQLWRIPATTALPVWLILILPSLRLEVPR